MINFSAARVYLSLMHDGSRSTDENTKADIQPEAEFAARSHLVLDICILCNSCNHFLSERANDQAFISYTKVMVTSYWLIDGYVYLRTTPIQECGPSTSGAQFCCDSSDSCREDSICHYNHPLVGGSGYYVGGCTDPSFPEPCSKSCCK